MYLSTYIQLRKKRISKKSDTRRFLYLLNIRKTGLSN